MSSSRDFSFVVKRGRRVARASLVVHIANDRPAPELESGEPGIVVSARSVPVQWGGPRVGLIVSKSVGNSVVRHTVSRRLRAAATTVLADLDIADRVVIRALPSARDASSVELAAQLRSGLHRLRAL
jgi:ribonuclease P protein component